MTKYIVVTEYADSSGEAFGTFGHERAEEIAAQIRARSSRYTNDSNSPLGETSAAVHRLEGWPGIRRFVAEAYE